MIHAYDNILKFIQIPILENIIFFNFKSLKFPFKILKLIIVAHVG